MSENDVSTSNTNSIDEIKYDNSLPILVNIYSGDWISKGSNSYLAEEISKSKENIPVDAVEEDVYAGFFDNNKSLLPNFLLQFRQGLQYSLNKNFKFDQYNSSVYSNYIFERERNQEYSNSVITGYYNSRLYMGITSAFIDNTTDKLDLQLDIYDNSKNKTDFTFAISRIVGCSDVIIGQNEHSITVAIQDLRERNDVVGITSQLLAFLILDKCRNIDEALMTLSDFIPHIKNYEKMKFNLFISDYNKQVSKIVEICGALVSIKDAPELLPSQYLSVSTGFYWNLLNKNSRIPYNNLVLYNEINNNFMINKIVGEKQYISVFYNSLNKERSSMDYNIWGVNSGGTLYYLNKANNEVQIIANWKQILQSKIK